MNQGYERHRERAFKATEEELFARSATPVPGDLENRALRRAVRENLVSFPAQLPIFERHSQPGLQQKIVILYFVRGWTMHDIGERYGLGRQRMGQILTAWRRRAMREGFLQAIAPEHPLYERLRLEQTKQFVDGSEDVRPVAAKASKTISRPIAKRISPAPETQEPGPSMSSVAELNDTNAAEQLQTIVGILDNQLLLCNIDSCEHLLILAKNLCARLEVCVTATNRNDERRRTAAVSAAKELFQRFEYPCSPAHSDMPPRTRGRAAVKDVTRREVPAMSNPQAAVTS